MGHDFIGVAERIAGAASEGGIDVKGIGDIVSTECGDNVNCYPGVPCAHCYDIAFFFSFNGRLKKGGGHYNFEQILQKLVTHCQGVCSGKTRHAVLITDSWWSPNYENWRSNIEVIKTSGVVLEAYLIGFGGWVNVLTI